jgi:trigger factor
MLRRVLAAVVDAEGIEPGEDELLAALEHSAEHESTTPKKLLERLRSAGRLDALRRDLATRKAADLLADSAKAISVEHAKARDKLWTPDKDASSEGPDETAKAPAGGLWTPGS